MVEAKIVEAKILNVEAKILNDLPIVVQPLEAQNNNAKNKNQIWFVKYGKEFQGLFITDRELGSHYYDIRTALLDTFLNYSSAILILAVKNLSKLLETKLLVSLSPVAFPNLQQDTPPPGRSEFL